MTFSFTAGLPALTFFPRSGDAGTQSPDHDTLINVFVALQMIGLIGSVALVLTTTLSSRAPRTPTWQNFFTSWIISTISYSLLLFAGQLRSRDPPFGVCLAQAGLIYGTPSLAAATTFGLVVQIWFSTQSLTAKKIPHERIWTLAILVLPYLVLFSMVLASWVIGSNNPELVKLIGSGMYCHIGPTGALGKVSATIVTILLLPTLVFEVLICVSLRRNWSTFRRMKNSLSIVLRVIIFSVIGVLAIVLSAIFVFSANEDHGASVNIVLALIPVLAVIVFSSQRDIISVWMFWRPREGRTLGSSSSSKTAEQV
ncbi:hypothetical protein FB45DRAFT_449330 [Roridomyces roridus]|uniref:Uncharacterized protein n=1 Tax=Roridomyces roridus TaxID=1738132 RepID=A0AAD7C1N8_9AGAR|nr:hypothetical protein FB45DRAFT_449330 [Roridomyces roridus]